MQLILTRSNKAAVLSIALMEMILQTLPENRINNNGPWCHRGRHLTKAFEKAFLTLYIETYEFNFLHTICDRSVYVKFAMAGCGAC